MATRKILQMQAIEPGWYARYVSGEKLWLLRIAVMASVRELDRNGEPFDHVLPVVAGDGTFPCFADYHQDYAGLEFRHGETKEEIVEALNGKQA